MKINTVKGLIILVSLLPMILFFGCRKNVTHFYEDENNNGLSIFSNSGNNIMSCYVNGRIWRTINREISGGFSGPSSYELEIYRDTSSITNDIIQFEWIGDFGGTIASYDKITMLLKVPKKFPFTRLKEFNNRRIQLDTTNGYFYSNIGGINNYYKKAPGVVFFQSLKYDSISPSFYRGKMAGLFEANFPNFKITNGRFDHTLVVENFK